MMRSSTSRSSALEKGGVMMGERRLSEDSALSGSSGKSRGSESGADVFNRGVKRGWKKIVGGY
jgi:hypothetical protein